MAVFTLQKTVLQAFLRKVMESSALIAPVKTDAVRFELLTDPARVSEVYLAENSFFPPKEFFFRKREVVFQQDDGKIDSRVEKPGKRVFFGLRKCDLNAIMHQDMVFKANNYCDPYYDAQRDGAILIGFHCERILTPYCFCGSMDLKDFYDLMFFDNAGGRASEYLVDVGSVRGLEFVKSMPEFFKPSKRALTAGDRATEDSTRLSKGDIKQFYDRPEWKTGVRMCISCGACTTLCPTCYCFEHKEVPSLADPKKSERVREWSSCQLKDFTRVAGGHVFRDTREARFKHRIYHQLQYFRDRNGINLCVGCGRCIQGCPTRIDFVKIINAMRAKGSADGRNGERMGIARTGSKSGSIRGGRK